MSQHDGDFLLKCPSTKTSGKTIRLAPLSFAVLQYILMHIYVLHKIDSIHTVTGMTLMYNMNMHWVLCFTIYLQAVFLPKH